MRHACGGAAVQVDLFHAFQVRQEALGQHLDAQAVGGHFFLGDAEGLAHADDLVGGQGARAHAALVTAAVHLRLDAYARLALHVEGADTLGTVGLVRGEGHQVDLQRFQVDFHLAGGLRRVDVEQDAAGTGHFADGGDVVDGADFVVHVHDRNQDGVVAQRRLDHRRGDDAVFAGLEVGDLEAFALELAGGVQHRLVLDLRGDQVLALAAVEVRSPLDRQVVGLGGTGGPDNLARVGIDQLGHLAAGVFHRLLGLPAEQVRTRGRIAEVAVHRQALAQLLRHARIGRRGRGIIQVDRQFHQVSPVRLRHAASFDGGRLNLFQRAGRYVLAVVTAQVLAQRHVLHVLALDQIGQTDTAEELVNPVAEAAPQMVGQADVAFMAAAEPLAAGGIDRFVDRIDDLRHVDSSHVARQLVATARTAHAGHQAATTELGEQLLEIGQGDALPLGNVGEGHRPALRMQRQIEHGGHGVTAFGGQSHGLAPRGSGSAGSMLFPSMAVNY
ncbi:hypothetical protein D3C81_1074840 [compost metagenome]